jgi:dipeptidyl aminopeptidase/acylaminoacyl peptidase
MVNSESFTLNVENISLGGRLFVPAESGMYPAVCICHGIPSGQPQDPGDGGYPELAERICRSGFAVLIFNFRGSRNSGGNFDILGWTSDLAAELIFLREHPQVDRSRIALLGYSAGAAVAICVGAGDAGIKVVAACASPADLSSLIQNTQLSVQYFRQIGIIRDRDFPESLEQWQDNFKIVNPLLYVEKISPRPLLLVHGDKDDVVPVADVYRLFEKAKEPKQLKIIEGGGHRLRRDERAVKTVIDWLKVVL